MRRRQFRNRRKRMLQESRNLELTTFKDYNRRWFKEVLSEIDRLADRSRDFESHASEFNVFSTAVKHLESGEYINIEDQQRDQSFYISSPDTLDGFDFEVNPDDTPNGMAKMILTRIEDYFGDQRYM